MTTNSITTTTTEEPTETTEKSYGDEIEALYDSQDYIRQYVAPFLTAPSTIKFPNYPVWSPDYGMSFKKVASNEYIVVAYFDSQNGFGAMVRTYYKCNVIMKEDSFIVKNFKFLNN
jgi:hypothetical protein